MKAVDIYLEEVQQKILARGDISVEDEKILARGDISVEDEIADSVFVQSFIPKTLEHVKNAEEDVQRITGGQDTGDMYYQTITGLKQALSINLRSSPEQAADTIEESSVKPVGHSIPHESVTHSEHLSDEDNSSDSEVSSSESESEVPVDKKAARKENRKKVKEEKREARKNKVPKAVKKRKKKLAKAQKTR